MTKENCVELIKSNQFSHKFKENCNDNHYAPIGRARNPRCELCALIKGSSDETFAGKLRHDKVGIYINED